MVDRGVDLDRSGIENWLGEVISRWSALTIPLVTVFQAKGQADRDDRVAQGELGRVADREGMGFDAGASTLITARSVEGSFPTSVAG